MTKQEKAWAESLLVAYVDGELDPAQTARVEEILRVDGEAQAIVGVLRRSAAAVRSAYDQPLQGPVPPRLLAAIGGDPGTASGANIIQLPRHRKPAAWRQALVPLAASIAMLAIGFGAGYLQFAGHARPASGSYQPAGGDSDLFATTLRQALDSSTTGTGFDYDDKTTGSRGTVTVTGRLVTSFDKACREFRHDWSTGAGHATAYGVACRSDAGEWSVLTVPANPAS